MKKKTDPKAQTVAEELLATTSGRKTADDWREENDYPEDIWRNVPRPVKKAYNEAQRALSGAERNDKALEDTKKRIAVLEAKLVKLEALRSAVAGARHTIEDCVKEFVGFRGTWLKYFTKKGV